MCSVKILFIPHDLFIRAQFTILYNIHCISFKDDGFN